MTILITGAGLIGSHFAQRATARGERVVFYDVAPNEAYLASVLGGASFETVRADVRDLPALTAAMQKYEPHTVLHTAGLIAAKVAVNSYTGVSINVMGATNVAEAARLCKVGKVMNCSTLGVYDWAVPHPDPMAETFAAGGVGLYGATKIAAESVLRAYADQYGFQIVSLRLVGVYGRGHFVGGSAGGETMHEIVTKPLRGEAVKMPRATLLTLENV